MEKISGLGFFQCKNELRQWHSHLTCIKLFYIIFLGNKIRQHFFYGLIACLEILSAALKSILNGQNRFWSNFELFGYICLESILVSRIDSGRSENFLLYVRITFRGTTKHK